MGQAEDVANELVAFFRSHGRYEDMSAEGGDVITPASTASAEYADLDAFAGLAVRAVGAAEGDKPRCYVYVTRSSRKLESQLPKQIQDVPILLRKVGRMQVRPEAAIGSNTGGSLDRDGKGRIRCGTSIAPAGARYSGTLGALLKGSNGKIMALSNNHVIGRCNHAPKGQPVTSPSGTDAARPGGPPLLQFALLESVVELRSGAVDHVATQRLDAALALVEDPRRVTSQQGGHFDTPAKAAAPREDMLVKKVGRTTGLTFGRVEAKVAGLFPLPYKDAQFTAVVNFTDVWSIHSRDGNPFGLPGDSGSLVVADDESVAVGLLFAVSKDGLIGFVCSLPDVLAGFGGGMKLLSGH